MAFHPQGQIISNVHPFQSKFGKWQFCSENCDAAAVFGQKVAAWLQPARPKEKLAFNFNQLDIRNHLIALFYKSPSNTNIDY